MSKSNFSTHYRLFLEELRLAREAKNLSQRELGRRLGVHHNFVSSCEMGDRTLSYVEVRAWCRALEVDWTEFTRSVDALLAAADGEHIQGNPLATTETTKTDADAKENN
ncbi:XRE family transcriptional regulator [bacterium]|nr:MAG: XRE family transcriptional regulator [bacterium]